MNRLATETSPYLQKHAADPVDWHTWNDEALARARGEDKPIHLSIGYSSCHWCGVLHREAFLNRGTADLLNKHFINIKVDREERPDLDRIYQIAHQMLTQRGGGWPLTMFLTPDDRMPFFGGTYFPDTARQGMPAFTDILQRVARYYREHRAEITKQNVALVEAFSTVNPPASDQALTDAPLHQARAILQDEFDSTSGGFGPAPKFPHPATVEFLLRYWRYKNTLTLAPGKKKKDQDEPDLQALFMATLTLRRMGEGGLFDQVGGGFCRYSVDQYWMIPHFEKMLFDNAALLAAYAQTAIATGDSFYARIAGETAEWALREMHSPDGGFYSSLDADSEGHEGRFYVWDREDIRRLLTPEEYLLVEQHYGLNRVANFEERWHLHVFEPAEQLAKSTKMPVETVTALLDSARAKLLAARDARTRPARDEKVLTSWNALMIRGLAIAARTLDRQDLGAAAASALHFIRTRLWRNGRLLATARDDNAHLPAYLDDYVFLADAILELQQYRWRTDEFRFAVVLMETALRHFEDKENGGFYFTADDHEQLIHRSRAFGDDATPSGNAVAVRVLNRLGLLLGETRYLDAAERTLKAGWLPLMRFPHGHATLLSSLDDYLHPPQTVIIRGSEAQMANWHMQLSKVYAPRRMVFAIPADAADLPAALAEKPPTERTVAYVCQGMACQAPVDSLEALARALR